MLRFIKHHMSTIDGVYIYPLISLLIFGLFFLAMLYYVGRMKKSRIIELSELPLDTDEPSTTILND